jgi:DNA-binding CsgD family transcriptional regulator/tetratricopeptide (TPR) repeat protein
MVLGRVAEQSAIDDLLRGVREGRSGALVIRGEPGIGKSTLLHYATQQANDMTVLSVRGYESESEIPFAGLADLIRPIMPLLDSLPAPQRAALQSAMSLGPPAAGDRFSVCAATVGVLAAAATQPLLVIVDDLQWLDVSSREAILFAARRLHADGIGLVMAARSGPDRAATDGEKDYAGLRQLRLEGLSKDDGDALCRTLLPGATADKRRRIYQDTAGNPLGIQELCSEVTDRRDSTGPREPAESRLTQALWGRLAELPERTRRALLLVASAGAAETDVVLRAARLAGLDLADFAPAEAAELLVVEERQITFRHPLLRSVLYSASSMHERAAAHAALADVLLDVPGEVAADARAWHLAAATLPPDPEVSQLLFDAGIRARRRGGTQEAARALEQAARFGTVETRPPLLMRAARCWQLAGRTGRVLPLLEEALAVTDDPALRAQIRHMSGYVRMWRALPRDGLAEMIGGAQEVEQFDSGRAALMYADAAIAYFMLGEPVEILRTTTRAFTVSDKTDGVGRLVAAVAHSGALVINGRRSEGQQLMDAVGPKLLNAPALPRAQELAHAAFISMWLEDYDLADKLLNRIISEARSAGALGVLPQALSIGSELAFRVGRWPQARAYAEESVELAGETRQANVYGLYFVARIDALQGRVKDCLEMVERLQTQSRRHEAWVMDLYAGHTLGLLALGQGDLEEAVRQLEAVRELPVAAQTKEQSIVPWAFDLVEAYIRAGRAAEASALLEQIAVDSGDRADYLVAMTWRCRGLLAAEKLDMTAAFERAMAAHDRCEMPFERARTLLCLGERLRRGRSRVPARKPLRRALEIFEQLGAVGWAARAQAELSATGETLTRGTGVVALLTPQELQVALVVAGGATNQEAAAALFLSQKTIEYHLSNIYRKTDLHSRGELAVLTEAAG